MVGILFVILVVIFLNFLRKKKTVATVTFIQPTAIGIRYHLQSNDGEENIIFLKDKNLPKFDLNQGEKVIIISAGFSTKFEKLP